MNATHLRLLADISAINARVAGMTAHNDSCVLVGNTTLYEEAAFLRAATELEQLSRDASYLAEAERS